MKMRLPIDLARLSALALLAGTNAGAQEKWFERALVGMEVGPTGAQFGHSDPGDHRYASDFDGAEIVRRCAGAGAEYLVAWVRDGDYAYYDSKILPKAPGLGERDPLRAAVAEAKKRKLPLISYCVVQQGGHYLAEHPEFQMRGPEGQPIGRFCFNSGYLNEMKRIVSEQLAYEIDGFHIDMLDQGFGKPYGCWCETCQSLFKKRFGSEMPKGATWDQAWDAMLEFRYDTSARFEKALTAHIRSESPAATVDYNYHGSPPFSFEVGQRPVQHAGNGDFVTGETGVWGFSALGVGLNAEFYRAATPGIPFQVAIQRGVRMYHDQTTRPLHDLRWEAFTLLAHGAFVTMIDKTGFTGKLDLVAYERMGKVLHEARRKRAHFGLQPVYDIGLYFSSRTRDWIGREDPGRYFLSIQGAHRACMMAHLQFGVILDENVTLDSLRRFPVVCLPNVAILSQRELDLLERYVQQGGKLLVTGQSGQFDPLGKPLEQSVLAQLVGADVKERLESDDNWISIDPEGTGDNRLAEVLSSGLPPNWPFLVKGPATVYTPTTAAVLGNLHTPHRTQRQLEGRMGTEWPMSPGKSVGPAVLVNRFGEGTVVTCAASPGFATGSEHALTENRVLFENLVRLLQNQRRIEIEAPSNVEAVVTDDPAKRELRVHFLAYNPTPRPTPPKNRPYVLPGLIEERPLFRVKVKVHTPVKNAAAFSPTSQVRLEGTTILATIEDVHEVLVINY